MTTTQKGPRALLISNSINHGSGYLDHVADVIPTFLGDIKRVLFFPFALSDWDGYTETARVRFKEMGIELTSIHEHLEETVNPELKHLGPLLNVGAIGIFVGGGNTFRLLATLQRLALDRLIRRFMNQGIPYIGASAGVNIACPTIMTTNDMPIVKPETFDALKIVPYQINPHYVDPDPNSPYMVETRAARIKEFHEESDIPVVGLREGSWILLENGISTIGGPKTARLFLKDKEPVEISGASTIEGAIQMVLNGDSM